MFESYAIDFERHDGVRPGGLGNATLEGVRLTHKFYCSYELAC
ncbi:MAG: hypothetical protein ACYTBZ_09735 [Planctomycetota bacterium]